MEKRAKKENLSRFAIYLSRYLRKYSSCNMQNYLQLEADYILLIRLKSKRPIRTKIPIITSQSELQVKTEQANFLRRGKLQVAIGFELQIFSMYFTPTDLNCDHYCTYWKDKLALRAIPYELLTLVDQ